MTYMIDCDRFDPYVLFSYIYGTRLSILSLLLTTLQICELSYLIWLWCLLVKLNPLIPPSYIHILVTHPSIGLKTYPQVGMNSHRPTRPRPMQPLPKSLHCMTTHCLEHQTLSPYAWADGVSV